jgi:hypothetical protein
VPSALFWVFIFYGNRLISSGFYILYIYKNNVLYIAYEYSLKWKINLHRLRSSEGTLTPVFVYEPETIKLNTDHYFIEQYNRQRALQKHLCRCLLASWNLDQNLGETYEYTLKWKINLHRLRSSEGTLEKKVIIQYLL